MINIIKDYYETNPLAPKGSFEWLLSNSVIWPYKWGLILAYGNSVHIHIKKDYRKRVFLRPYLKQVASFLFKKYPVIVTEVFKSKPTPLAFYTKIGWILKEETSEKWFLEMKEKDFRYG